MTLTSDLGRPLIAGMFVAGGFRQLKNPEAGVDAAERVASGPLRNVLEAVGAPKDPESLVRLNGAVQLAAGTALGLGFVPRLAATALAASVVPTTVGAHDFWNEDDPDERRAQQTAFTKNLAVLGGLLMAAGDTGGRPSLGWMARRQLGVTRREARRLLDDLAEDISELPERTTDAASRRAAETVGRATMAAAPRLARRRARRLAHDVADDVTDLPHRLSDAASRRAAEAVGRATIASAPKAGRLGARKLADEVTDLPHRVSDAASRRAAEAVGRATIASAPKAGRRRLRRLAKDVGRQVETLPERAGDAASRKANEALGRATVSVSRKAARKAAKAARSRRSD